MEHRVGGVQLGINYSTLIGLHQLQEFGYGRLMVIASHLPLSLGSQYGKHQCCKKIEFAS